MTETRKKHVAANELHSEKNKLKILKSYVQTFMKNSILEQAKLIEQGTDYMERTVKVKRQPV